MSHPKWFEKARPTCSVVPIRRFVNEHVFALKTGGYGCMFAVDGIDDEGLTDEAVADALKRVEGAFKGLPEDGRVYQYARIRKGFEISRQRAYENAHVPDAVADRITFWKATLIPDYRIVSGGNDRACKERFLCFQGAFT